MLELTLDMVDKNLPPAPPVQKKPKVSSDDSSDDEAEFNSDLNNPTDDPQLDEAVDIMSDYTGMLRDSGSKVVQAAAAPVSK